jgi:hypothetical protein
MVNLIVLIVYLIALAVFAFMSFLAIRHTVKFGYISSSFRTLAWIFGIIAVLIILFSAYQVMSLFKANGGAVGGRSMPVNTATDINY